MVKNGEMEKADMIKMVKEITNEKENRKKKKSNKNIDHPSHCGFS